MIKYFFPIAFILFAGESKSQNVGVGTSSPKARLHVADSAVVFTGSGIPIGDEPNPPITGPGHRMMWFPARAAFRVGNAGLNNWDRDSIGLFSFAAGDNPRAKGEASIALGKDVRATGLFSVALGKSSFASGDYSTAIGNNSIASGLQSTAIGNGNASGVFSIALGTGARASGQYSIATGPGTYASGSHSSAMGSDTYASGLNSTALGYSNAATGSNSMAFGAFTTAEGIGSIALGNNTTASGTNATVTGYFNESAGYSSFVAGIFNDPLVAPQTSVSSTTPLFIIGNGDDINNRSNALLVRKNGNVGIGSNSPFVKLHIDGGSDASLSSTSGFMVLGSITASNIVIDNNEIIARNNSAASILYLQSPGGNVAIGVDPSTDPAVSHMLDVNGTAGKPGGGSWASYSDARLKQNIHPYTDGLSSLMKINPVLFQYNKLSGHDAKPTYVGVIAQELQKISPYMVSSSEKKLGDGSPGYLQVDNSAMTYMLINAVKEQQKQIDQLKKIIETLRRQ